MNKVLFVGKMVDCGYPIFLKVKYEEGRFSISGVEGPLASGNCKGGCGQIQDSLYDIRMEGDLTREQLDKVLAYWERWHLNDLKAGSPDQEAHLMANPIEYDGMKCSHYEAASAELTAAGLNPDPEFMGKDGEPYVYGTAWNREEVPTGVIEFFESLPPSTRKPNWV